MPLLRSLRRAQRSLLRLILKCPVVLYRLRLGWLLRERCLLLTHTGRLTGVRHAGVREGVTYDASTQSYVVAAAWGEKAQWYRNVRRHPRVELIINRHRLIADACVLNQDGAEAALLDYARNHPFLVRALAQFVTGRFASSTQDAIRAMVQAIPFV